MQASNSPTKSAVPFAQSGTKNTIPVASQIGVTPGAASFTDGFPPLTMTPLAAGGVPPYGADFNGILNFLSAAVRWGQAGGRYPFDVDFSTAVGGYPKGAVLAAAGGNGSWLNLVDNNTTNPDAGGTNWAALGAGIASTLQAQEMTDDNVLLTPKKLADAFGGANQSLATVGHQKLPGGLILQWATVLSNSAGFAPWTYPIAFPNDCYSVVSTAGQQSGADNMTVSLIGTPSTVSTNSAVFVNGTQSSLAGQVSVRYLAWGR
ncbi:hypothetical protein [Achromobacter sp. K91]|uniref:gp53-like domain-containing protein n=1 Tax=Achromobacter sp. K91 TaxID=2292262 RepID=UPI0011C47830|nr:hypothetical protein [Achromobacter sp. K91]